MSDDDDSLKQQIIAHDVRAMGRKAAQSGRKVSEIHDSAGRVVGISIGGRLTRKELAAQREQVSAEWEAALSKLTIEQVLPALTNVFRKEGKKALLNVALRIYESRQDLRPAVNEATNQLGLTSEWQRAELRYIDRVWKRLLGPGLQVEHLAPMVAAAQLKGEGVLEVWTQRIRQHRPDLMPALSRILSRG